MDSVIKKSHIFLILASFNGPLLNPELHLKPFSSQSPEWPSCLKYLMISYYYTRALLSQTVGLLEVFRVSKSRMGGTVVSYQLPIWVQETGTSYILYLQLDQKTQNDPITVTLMCLFIADRPIVVSLIFSL